MTGKSVVSDQEEPLYSSDLVPVGKPPVRNPEFTVPAVPPRDLAAGNSPPSDQLEPSYSSVRLFAVFILYPPMARAAFTLPRPEVYIVLLPILAPTLNVPPGVACMVPVKLNPLLKN